MKNENFLIKIFAGTHDEVRGDIDKWLITNQNIHIVYTSQSESMASGDELYMNLTISVWYIKKDNGIKFKRKNANGSNL